MKHTNKSFEEKEKRLAEIVARLEKNQSTLEESMTLFEEGVALVGELNKILDAAEQKVRVLTDVSEKDTDSEQ